jgi:hypothetical protein
MRTPASIPVWFGWSLASSNICCLHSVEWHQQRRFKHPNRIKVVRSHRTQLRGRSAHLNIERR